MNTKEAVTKVYLHLLFKNPIQEYMNNLNREKKRSADY
jgi:hypothetical protein